LRKHGQSVIYVAELEAGLTDDEVLGRATAAGALLLTEDKDFGELVYRMHRPTCGVVLIRLQGLSSERKAQIVGDFIDQHQQHLAGMFAVITPGKLRIRGDEPPI
jgi:predicted nuclease of predicted toxin-antitoxin system